MSFIAMLDRLIFGPLILLYDLTLSVIRNAVTENSGLMIALLCLAINLLALPLWRGAEALRDDPRSGPQGRGGNGSALPRTIRDFLPLLIDIPFLIVAYRYLRQLQVFQGVAFGPIADLGAPDALLRLSGHTVNLLPLLMAFLGLLAGLVYTRGRPIRVKILACIKVAACLVLLYKAPASLTLYWLFNSLICLGFAILYRLFEPRRVLHILLSVLGLMIVCLIIRRGINHRAFIKLMLIAFGVLLQLPLLSGIFRKPPKSRPSVRESKDDRALFLVGGAFLTLFIGALIPLNVIQSSPEEFVDISNFHTSLQYVASSLMLAAGAFLLWPSVYYRLLPGKARRSLGLVMILLCVIAAIDYFFFGNGYGTMSTELIYESRLVILKKDVLTNMAAIMVGAALVLLAWKKGRDILPMVGAAACLALVVMSAFGAISIQSAYHQLLSNTQTRNDDKGISFPLDRSGKNVMVIMVDRGMGRFLPYIMQEKPELQQRFSGFTYYGNTLSYGSHTNVGAPGVFGGYEYTPLEMHRRSDELLADKHNEALKLMPALFHENGYDVTVCDPPYAGYKQVPDLSIYDDLPDINTYITLTNDAIQNEEMLRHCDEVRHRNFFCYGFFRSAPLFMQRILYCFGQYNEVGASWTQVAVGLTKATGMNYSFMKNSGVLSNLPDYSNIRDEGKNTFLMFYNATPHQPTLLQEPDYTPAMSVDNTAYEGADSVIRQGLDGTTLEMTTINQVEHYHANMATMLLLANWFDYLRSNGVYDNTRIIIVSDHGFRMDGLFDLRFSPTNAQDMLYYCPLLMVKDFDSTEFTVDNSTFMTNADTPLLALDGLVENPVNPFTGKALSDAQKHLPEQQVAHEANVRPYSNNGTTYKGLEWYANKNNIFDLSDWRYVGAEPED